MRGSVRSRRIRAVVSTVIVALVIAWLVVGTVVFVNPRVDHPTKADALVVLGPPTSNDRLGVARQLLDAGVSDQLVISINSPKQWQARDLCEHPPAGVTVTCFTPDPSTTRGEAEEARRLATEHGWTSLVVITSTFHVSRARMIFERCFAPQDVQMVAATEGIGLGTWAYQYLYQSGAYVKAWLQSGC